MLTRRIVSGTHLVWNNLTSSLSAPTRRSFTRSWTCRSAKVIFSGIQPTGIPHLGNYLGALKRWEELQNELDTSNDLFFSLVDLHALTIRQDPAQLRKWRNESLAMLLAIGLDPKRSTVFYQSDVPAHAELMWILSCQASTGYLARMTQWKDKTSNEREHGDRLKLGLFSYPVLMASDVLLHDTTHVPVGHDQAQHLEFAREIAIGFNSIYGAGILSVPQTMISPARRIMSLTDPIAKMSKSNPNVKSRILLTDSSEEIQSKIKGALTDSQNIVSYDPTQRPGVSNLIDIMFYSQSNAEFASQHELAKDMRDLSMRALKEKVATSIEHLLRPIREQYLTIIDNQAHLDEIAATGAERANQSASRTMERVKQALGLL